jgi:6-phosphogluconolactonase
MLKDNWIIFKDAKTVSERLASDIISIANKSLDENGKFTIVLAGGVSFINLYKILRETKSNWSQWYIYLCDERCLPKNDKDRNDKKINEAWLNNGKIPKKNINFICAELDIKDAVEQYELVLKNIGNFDLVLLGMGDDGHTASLFPNHTYNQNKSVVAEYNSPKYPKKRISLSYSRLNKSKYVFKLISGPSKVEALNLWINGKNLPINQIYGEVEKVYICNNVFYDKYYSGLITIK